MNDREYNNSNEDHYNSSFQRSHTDKNKIDVSRLLEALNQYRRDSNLKNESTFVELNESSDNGKNKQINSYSKKNTILMLIIIFLILFIVLLVFIGSIFYYFEIHKKKTTNLIKTVPFIKQNGTVILNKNQDKNESRTNNGSINSSKKQKVVIDNHTMEPDIKTEHVLEENNEKKGMEDEQKEDKFKMNFNKGANYFLKMKMTNKSLKLLPTLKKWEESVYIDEMVTKMFHFNISNLMPFSKNDETMEEEEISSSYDNQCKQKGGFVDFNGKNNHLNIFSDDDYKKYIISLICKYLDINHISSGGGNNNNNNNVKKDKNIWFINYNVDTTFRKILFNVLLNSLLNKKNIIVNHGGNGGGNGGDNEMSNNNINYHKIGRYEDGIIKKNIHQIILKTSIEIVSYDCCCDIGTFIICANRAPPIHHHQEDKDEYIFNCLLVKQSFDSKIDKVRWNLNIQIGNHFTKKINNNIFNQNRYYGNGNGNSNGGIDNKKNIKSTSGKCSLKVTLYYSNNNNS